MVPRWLLAAGATAVPEIARDAWIFAYPMLMHYQTMQRQVLDPQAAEYVGGFNCFRHYSQLYTPANREVVTPNNDTPYSWAWLDLRSEPQVLSVPAVADDRYYVHQLVDQYTHNFGYVGVLSTGRDAGDYLIAGPRWNGSVPSGVKAVLRSETEIVLVLGRTGLKNNGDLPAVRALQQQYRLRALHEFVGDTAPASAPPINWPKWDSKSGLGPAFIGVLNQILELCPTQPSEINLRERFAQIGIVPGQRFNLEALSVDQLDALNTGIKKAQEQLQAAVIKVHSTLGLFGNRDALAGNYMNRAVGAHIGIYGNSVEEAFYTGARLDNQAEPLRGGRRYRLRFAPEQLPPAKEFTPSRPLFLSRIRHLSRSTRSAFLCLR
ncbi:DUF1254 domain-containing protein [Pseudomonas fluorescens]|uniref:DUF1254 domain-containing protein n=1 Tax=Pseudomonas fluorescens TaxID=294 RepID=UPI0020A09FFF|nr:DUF1254 domain-containing protein [Pseudomonas fluorescens]